MKVAAIFLTLCFFTGICFPQSKKAIFLVHSTGTNLYSQGKVSDWIKDYNSINGSNFQITTRTYPEKPWSWSNYPHDYWKLWVDNSCDNSDPDIECLASLASKYDLVIFKHCYPGAGIEIDIGKPDITSGRKSIENYKLQYRALRSLMDGMPDKKFMVWTLVPLHRLNTNFTVSSRANEFVHWVKNQWLTEDGKVRTNIFIFDFFSLAAETKENPDNGIRYCLKYDYESSHTVPDSHPNVLANQTIGPLFAKAVVEVLSSNLNITSISISSSNDANTIDTNKGTLQLQATILPDNASNKTVTWSVLNVTGKSSITSNGMLTAEKDGTVKAIATANDASGITGELTVTISNQKILVQSISIIDNLEKDTIHGIGTKLSLEAEVIPPNATDKSVQWVIENITGKASINNDGLLTTTSPGLIKVTAKASDESNIQCQKEYMIAIPNAIQNLDNSFDFMVYQNPITENIKVHLNKTPSEGVFIEIRNVIGQKLLKQKLYNNISELAFKKSSGRLYLVTVSGKSNFVTKKIVF